MVVYVDGVAVGSPSGWGGAQRPLRALPGYPGIDSALGVFGLNTYAFGNGLHTIVWVVTDNAGVTSGVGSRYFSIFNSNAQTASASSAMRPAGTDLGRRLDQLPPVSVGQRGGAAEGFQPAARPFGLPPGIDGVRRVWATRTRPHRDPHGLKRPAGSNYEGYLVANGRLTELPVGSAFDPSRGAFYWQPGLAFMGDYDLMFVRRRRRHARAHPRTRHAAAGGAASGPRDCAAPGPGWTSCSSALCACRAGTRCAGVARLTSVKCS